MTMQEKYHNSSTFQIKMSHRKSNSCSESFGSRSVPFSWEEKPGIPKFVSPAAHQSSTNNKAFIQKSISSHKFHSPLNMMVMSYSNNYNNMKISPPPQMARPPSRSPSMKGLLWARSQDDPFAAAIKKCTKSSIVRSYGDSSGGSQKYFGSTTKDRIQNIMASCKRSSSDVKEGNLVRLVDLPPQYPRGHRNNKSHAR
ncbi:hypothetical protein ACH5RR_013946 [Cinchona calisaya]|uniref:Uncharacterized protein n=1 Tax=Cinchona calisaya TaxID=153742 RepID=A0ABD3A2X2_9GENT